MRQLSIHSSMMITVRNSPWFGDFDVQYYTGVEGFTGFHSGSEWLRPWVYEFHSLAYVDKAAAISSVALAGAAAALSNLTVREYNFPMGGYGGLGVCNDSVALLEMAATGRTRIFPLLARADAKCALIVTCKEVLQPSLRRTLSGPQAQRGGGREERAAEVARLLDQTISALLKLPSDIQVQAEELPDTADRLFACCMDSPFHLDQEMRRLLPIVKSKWV